jgi:hypothetical protein
VDCTLIESDLVPFHFGADTDTPRDALEVHLAGCARCLGSYLALKRAAERGPGPKDDDGRPSEAARARLRDAVASELRSLRPAPRGWLWGGAAAAVVVAAALLGFFTHSDQAAAPVLPPAPAGSPQNIDSARPEPLNLDFI